MKILKNNFALILLLLISFLIRFYKINNLSLFSDEIDVGYQAFSLSQTGRDYKGNFLPFYIQSLTESRAPLLIYLTIPGIKIFGLTSLGVRIAPIVFGVLSIYLFCKLVFLLSESNRLAFLSAFCLSIMPWHFHYSRAAFEVTLLLSLILAAVYFSFKFLKKNKNIYIYLAIVFFSLSFYTYNTANIFVPLIVLVIFFSNLKKFLSKLNLKNFFISLAIFLLLVSPLIHQIFFGAAANRFNLISIFHNQTLIDQIITKRTTFSAVSPQIESVFHNKPLAWFNEFAANYLTSLSPSFLFVSGDRANFRHTIPGFGLIFIAFFPFLFKGFLSLNLKDRLNQFMFFWLIFSPVASSLTVGGDTHATRLFLMTVPLAFFSALGLHQVLSSKNIFARLFILISSVLLFVQVCGYTHEYFTHYPQDSFEVWNYGYQELFESIPQTGNTIFISNAKYNSLLPFSFYQKYKLNHGYLDDLNTDNIYNDLSGFKLSQNIYFINNWQSSDIFKKISQISQSGDVLLLFQGNDIPGDMDLSQESIPGFSTIKTVYNPNQTILGQVIQKI